MLALSRQAFVGSTHSCQEINKMLVWCLRYCCSSGALLEDRLMSKAPSSAVQGQQQPCWGAGRVMGSGHPFLPHLSTPCVALFNCHWGALRDPSLWAAWWCSSLCHLVRGGNHSREEQEMIISAACGVPLPQDSICTWGG